jgi:phospholipase C
VSKSRWRDVLSVLIHARKVSQLPVRNDHGYYDEVEPQLSSSSEFGAYIRDRSAAWSQHMQRQRTRRAGRGRHPRLSPSGD